MVKDLNVFCALDGLDELHMNKRCTAQKLLTNLWWRLGIIGLLFMRIIVNCGQLIDYAAEKEKSGRIYAGIETANVLYDMGDDFGGITRYIVDFHQLHESNEEDI